MPVDLGARRAPLRASVLAPAVGSLDYLLRPYLIKGGADLPLLLILVGVIGGLISLEIIGLFVGLTVLAVT